MPATPPSEEDSSEIKQVFKNQRCMDEEENRAKNGEELDEDLERDFLEVRIPHVIPDEYKNDSDESISFSDNIIAERCC